MITVLCVLLAFSSSVYAAPIILFDSTVGLDTSSQYSLFSNTGYALEGEGSEFPLSLGPQFLVSQPTIIREVGAFLYFGALANGMRTRANGPGLSVSVYTEGETGPPCVGCRLGTFALTNTGDELSFAFEHAAVNLYLTPGRYYAMFHPTGMDLGSIMRGNISVPVASIEDGSTLMNAAVPVRIIGHEVPEPRTTVALLILVIVFGMARRRTGVVTS